MTSLFAFRSSLSTGLSMALLLLWLPASAQYFSATVYKDQEELPSNRIQDIAQMANGEIWFLTEEGISIYDGLDWRRLKDSLDIFPRTGLRLTALPDSSMFLFGAFKTGYALVSYKNGHWSVIALPSDFDRPQGPAIFVTDTSKTSASFGHLCLSYLNKVYRYDGQTWSSFEVFPSGDHSQINQIRLTNDSLLIATNQGLLLHTQQALHSLLENERILDFEVQNQTIYLLGENWIGRTTNGSITKYFSNVPIGLPNNFLTTHFYVRRNKIYYSYNSPLFSYDIHSKQRQTILSQSFGENYTCMKALFDHENNLWIATLRGAFKISNIDVYSYNQTQLIEDEVTAIMEAENGDIFLGANAGFSILSKTGNIVTHPFPETIIQPRVMDIVEFGNAVYMACNTAGFMRYNNGEISYFLPEKDDTRALDLQIHDGRLYGSSGGNIYELIGSRWERIASLTPRDHWFPMIRKIYFEGDVKYLLTPIGVFDCLRNQYIPFEEPELGNAYTCVSYNDQLLFGTLGGLAKLENDSLVRVASARDPEKARIYALLIDKENNLWMGGDKGILRVNDDQSVTQLSKSNGLIGSEINRNALVQLEDGRIMIGTDQGMSVYEPESDISFPTPTIELTEITANDETIYEALDYDQNNLRFSFRSISFYDEQLVNYRYKLTGFETDWKEIPYYNQRSVQYTNMQPGSYRFTVQGRVGTGNWSTPATSGLIRIEPAYYNQLWFQILIGTLLAGIVFLLVRFRSRQLKKTNQLLQNGIREKTHELHRQNEELLRTITELKTAQGQLIQSEKLASMGQLTAGIAHEMNNPLNYIRGGAECLRQNLEEINDLHNQILTGGNRKELLKLKTEYEYLVNESKQLLESILNGAQKSTSIVKSLSSFTADSQNFYSFIELDREIETALTLLSNQIGFRIYINKFYGNTPRIECYPAKIHQLLVNLLLNAIQAIKEEGEISIRIYRKDEKNVGLEINDTGEGISAEDLDKIFEPFFTTKDSNPGLGLTIARAIVQDHNGEIRLRSKKNKGSRVTVILPLQQTFHPELDAEFSIN